MKSASLILYLRFNYFERVDVLNLLIMVLSYICTVVLAFLCHFIISAHHSNEFDH